LVQAFLRDAVGSGGDDTAHVSEITLEVELYHRALRILD
jgi:hypothetical protein